MLALGGCGALTDPGAPQPAIPSASPWVTPEVAARLDASGRFIFGDLSDESGRETITAVRARQIARAFVNTFLRQPLTTLLPGAEDPRAVFTRIHGQQVQWAELEPVGPAAYPMMSPVFTAVDAIPIADLSSVGARYHVIFGTPGAIVLDVMVSVYATDVVLSADGSSVRSLGTTDAIRVDALPAGRVCDLAIIPEVAVRSVGLRGRSVAAPPELIMPWGGLTTLGSRWRLRLDAPLALNFATGDTVVVRDEIYVGFLPDSAGFSTLRWYVASDSQPTSAKVRLRLDSGTVGEVTVGLAPQYPTRYEEVRLPPVSSSIRGACRGQ